MQVEMRITKLGAGPTGVRVPGDVVRVAEAEAKALEQADAGERVAASSTEGKQGPVKPSSEGGDVETADSPPRSEKATVSRGRKKS